MSEEPKPRSTTKYHDTQFWLLGLVGVGTDEFSARWKRWSYNVYGYSITFMYGLFSVMTVTELSHDFPTDFGFMLLRLSMLLLGLAIYIKRSSLSMQARKDMAKLNESLNETILMLDTKNQQVPSPITKKQYKIFTTIVKTFYSIGIVTAFIFLGASAYFKVPPFPVPYVYLFEVFGISLYLWQCIMIFYTYFNFIAYDMIIISFMSRIITVQLIIQDNWMKLERYFPLIKYEKYVREYEETVWTDVDEVRDESWGKRPSYDQYMTYDKTLMRMITQFIKENTISYEKVMRIFKGICNIFELQLLFHFTAGVIVLALMSVSVIKGDITSMGSHRIICFLVCAAYDIWVFGYYGTKIQELHLSVAWGIYNTPWYEMDYKTRKYLLSTIHSLQHKKTITAAGFFPVNFHTCLAFYKMTYNFIALLQSVN